MAKQRISDYTFDASEKLVTFTDYTTIDLEALLLIVNVTDNIIVYNFADEALGGTITGNAVVLDYVTTGMDDADKLLIYYDTPMPESDFNVNTVVVKSTDSIQDWTGVAQNTISKSAVLDCSSDARTLLHIQAFLNTATAHTGTEFIIQTSANSSGNEDWHDYTSFIGLVGTANGEVIAATGGYSAGATGIEIASNTGYTTNGQWRAIEDDTLVNSELFLQSANTTTLLTPLDPLTNAHAYDQNIWNVALSQSVVLDASVYRARVVVNNCYDADGSTIVYKVRTSKVTSL